MRTLPMSPVEIDALAHDFESRPAEDLLAWAAERFAGHIVLTCSWQRQSSVMIDMLHRIGAEVRLVEIDTGLLFPETHDTRERLVERYGIEVERLTPRQSVAEQAETEGPSLWRREPDRCCALRKVEPMQRALDGMDAWITGIRREQSGARARARKLELDLAREVVKVQPLVDWSEDDAVSYLDRHGVPYHSLHDRGFPSIGCMPCTRAVREGEDPRAGRWSGSGKTECGLHLPAPAALGTAR